MNEEIGLAKRYLREVELKDTATNQEIAYWNYELYIRSQETHSSKIRGLVQIVHKEELKNY